MEINVIRLSLRALADIFSKLIKPDNVKEIYSAISFHQSGNHYIYISAALGGQPVAFYRNMND